MLTVFVDFDGTITDVDTIDTLLRAFAGDAFADALEADLRSGRITQRAGFERQARAMRLSQAETLSWMLANTTVDPTFGPFVEAVRASGGSVCVVSSGIASVIAAMLERAGVQVQVFANDVDYCATGWNIDFIDDSANAHDKRARVLAARAAGARTVYAGDGMTDFEAAAAADRCFAKSGSSLEAHCLRENIPYEAFAAFAEIAERLGLDA